MQTQDQFLDEFRGTITNARKTKKKFVIYSTKEVDRIISDLQGQQLSMQEAYQDRFEDQRLSLLALSRERDELARENEALTKQLATAHDWQKLLADQGLVAVDRHELESLRAQAVQLESVEAGYHEMAAEAAAVKEQLASINRVNEDYERLQQATIHLQNQAMAAKNEAQSLAARLQREQDQNRQLVTELENVQKEGRLQIKAREKQMQLIIERYQNAMVSHGQNVRQMLDSYLEYVQAMESYGVSIIKKHQLGECEGNQDGKQTN